jgi:PAS domain S-box-containing protein
MRAADMIANSEQTLRAFVAQAPVAMAMFDREMRYLAVSDRWVTIYKVAVRDVIGRSHYEIFPDIPDRWREAHRRGLAGEELQADEDEFVRSTGSSQFDRWHLQPWRTEDGEIGGIIITTEDVTARVMAERALRESEQQLRLALDAADMGIWEWDLSTRTYRWNDQTYRMFGYEPQSFVPDYSAWAVRVHPDDLPKLEEEAKLMMENPREAFGEYRAYGQNDQLRWLEARGRFECDADGRPKRYYGILMDITERKRAEEKGRILTAEVNHRAKNLLAVVQAVAKQTARMDDPREFTQNFDERLAGLAASHDLLVQAEWRGVDTATLIRAQLAHFADLIGTRILLDGPTVLLKADAAQNLGMALHELGTNASKYGALSHPSGVIHLGWSISDSNGQPKFEMCWREQNGPAVTPPTRRGFGQVVMVDMLEYSLDAQVSMTYDPTGLVWHLKAPVDQVTQPPDAIPSRGQDAPSDR